MRKRVEVIALLLIAIVVLAGTHLYTIFYSVPSAEPSVRRVEFPRGTSFRLVALGLEREGVVRDADDFMFAARLLGAQKKVKAGEYEFTTSMTPLEVLAVLVAGKVKQHMLTIPEGYNIRDISVVLEDAGLVDAGEFMAAAKDRRVASRLGIDAPTLEGYLFPDTYSFTRGMEPVEIITAMVERFKSVYLAEFDELARKKGMTMSKVVTLASIIEKETGAPDERQLISAVFHNRLKKRIRLQSDPTVIYAIEDFDGNLTRRHLRTHTPYNTYLNYGLPPGPIANPGRESIRAALEPAAADYLYFVSRNDGTHHFSKSLREHNRAVDRFQKRFKKNSSDGRSS